jgi:hypothetical protein
VVRRWLASLLPECPTRDDVISIVTELGSNALRHTASGRSGVFAVEVTWHESVVRVAVADGGGPTEPHVIEDPPAEHGRGLLLVRGLSVRTGVTGDHRGRLVWADIAWDGSNAPADTLAALARRFDVPAWFGHSTLAWWALAGPHELVTAPSARELADLLYRRADAPAPPQRSGGDGHVGFGTGQLAGRDSRGARHGRVGRNPGRLQGDPGWPAPVLAPAV